MPCSDEGNKQLNGLPPDPIAKGAGRPHLADRFSLDAPRGLRILTAGGHHHNAAGVPLRLAELWDDSCLHARLDDEVDCAGAAE